MTRQLRKPLVELIKDVNIRESLQWLYEYLIQVPMLKPQFQFFEIKFNGVVTGEKLPHKLGFQPKDIILTSTIGAGTATFNYAKFDATNLDISTSGAVVIRFFAGRY